MRNQSSNLAVAPRAGFEPATNRLTASAQGGIWRKLPVIPIHRNAYYCLLSCENDVSWVNLMATGNASIFVANMLPNSWERNPRNIEGIRAIAKRQLTDRSLQALKPAAAGKHYDVMDTTTSGFGVRVSETARPTFILFTRFPGSRNPTRRSLGRYGDVTLKEAREKARSGSR